MESKPEKEPRITISMRAESLLASGAAKTKGEATAMARLEIAKRNADAAAAKVKALEDAQKRLAKEQAQKERFAKTQKERRERTRKLIAAGGLVAKAGLLDWDPALLLGGLLLLKSQDETMMAKMKGMGQQALNAKSVEATASGSADPTPQAGKVRVAVETPAGVPPAEVRQALKDAGLSFKEIGYQRDAAAQSLDRAWQGVIPQAELERFDAWAKGWGGVLVVLN